MTPYLPFIKRKYLNLIYFLPFNLLLLLLKGEEMSDFKRFYTFKKVIKEEGWYKSEYTKLILEEIRLHLEKFETNYQDKKVKGNFRSIQKTFVVLEHFLSPAEIKTLIEDLKFLIEQITRKHFSYKTHSIESITDTHVENENFSMPGENELLTKLHQFLAGLPVVRKSFNSYLIEFPFQLFIMIAGADGTIDQAERKKFFRIIKDRNWGRSKCTQLVTLSTLYSYEELFSRYNKGALKISFNNIQKTLLLMNTFFIKNEVETIKEDIYLFAKEIAKASGGFAGISSICKEEEEQLKRISDLFEKIRGSVRLSYRDISATDQKENKSAEKLPKKLNNRYIPVSGYTVFFLADSNEVKTNVKAIGEEGILINFHPGVLPFNLFGLSTITISLKKSDREIKVSCKIKTIYSNSWTKEGAVDNVVCELLFLEKNSEEVSQFKNSFT